MALHRKMDPSRYSRYDSTLVRAAYPLMLDVTARPVVIIGGGRVAIRKARGLIEAGATDLRMIAPEFREDVPQAVRKIAGCFEPRHLEGAGLVFAATDSPEVNAAVVREARRRGILVSRADSDDEQPGDFATPAVLREGPMTVTVFAGGAPALAAMVRDELAARFDPRWSMMASAIHTLRPKLLAASSLTPARRREAFRDLATVQAIEILSAGGLESLRQWLAAKYPEL